MNNHRVILVVVMVFLLGIIIGIQSNKYKGEVDMAITDIANTEEIE